MRASSPELWLCENITPCARASSVARKCRRSRLRRARTPWTVRNPPRPPGKARPYSPSFPCGSPLRHLTLAADGPRQRGAVDSCRPDGERRQPRGAGHRGEGATARVCAVAGRRICSRPECSGGAPVKDVKYLVCARVCLPQGLACVVCSWSLAPMRMKTFPHTHAVNRLPTTIRRASGDPTSHTARGRHRAPGPRPVPRPAPAHKISSAPVCRVQ